MEENIRFIIKVYMIKENKQLQYTTTLPYVFAEKPINICNQFNVMFKDSFEHIIDIYTGV